jgi:RHS repeat-associated protein
MGRMKKFLLTAFEKLEKGHGSAADSLEINKAPLAFDQLEHRGGSASYWLTLPLLFCAVHAHAQSCTPTWQAPYGAVKRDGYADPATGGSATAAMNAFDVNVKSLFSYLDVGDATRDGQGRVISKTEVVNDNPSSPSSYVTGYSWINGLLASISYPSGLNVYYRRTAGRITGIDVQEPQNGAKKPKVIAPFLANLTYTALGQPKAWTWSNGDGAARSFDADGRMTANEFASYGYDAASRITSITQNLYARDTTSGTGVVYTTPLTFTAGYDSRDRLTSFMRDGSASSYTYDANSNRLTSVDKVTSDTDLNGEFDDVDFTKATNQALGIDSASNKLLGMSQTITTTNNGKIKSTVDAPIAYSLDANGAMTSDGLRTFQYDGANRLAKVELINNGEAASVSYLHNTMGQRVFKSEVQAEQTLPNEADLGAGFVGWLKSNFSWMFAKAQANATIGTAYVYGDGAGTIPSWALLGEYGNGAATGAGRTEYIWMPTADGQVIPIGMYRAGHFYSIHSDHIGTPRLITDEAKAVVWQWPYSAFGNNKPTGILAATTKPKQALTIQPVLLKATAPVIMNMRMPGQYADSETGTFYNYFRQYDSRTGRYTQADPIGLDGGGNRFAYVSGNSLIRIDPMGQQNVVFTAGGSLTVGGAGGEKNSGVGVNLLNGAVSAYTTTGLGAGLDSGFIGANGSLGGTLSFIGGNANNVGGVFDNYSFSISNKYNLGVSVYTGSDGSFQGFGVSYGLGGGGGSTKTNTTRYKFNDPDGALIDRSNKFTNSLICKNRG